MLTCPKSVSIGGCEVYEEIKALIWKLIEVKVVISVVTKEICKFFRNYIFVVTSICEVRNKEHVTTSS